MMRSFGDAKARWEETLKHSDSISDLQRAVRFNGPGSPCLAGSRSVCWRVFLLLRDSPPASWSEIIHGLRVSYSEVRDRHLSFIKHPELLADLALDPLADDPESPWDALRKDELVRAEILQDVQRLPDEPFYHQESTQTMILDILFIYCKLNPSAGGYRQGMHELLAPIVHVVYNDAVERATIPPDGSADSTMMDMLDSDFIEHDAFALFAKIMQPAQAFYEIGNANAAVEQSTIVEKSQYIHEVVLMKADPELAVHLKNTEILPQIFLIRWIRLLFGREFPFEQLLIMWDTIFAFDPSLDLIDLICVAMLIRIRWTLLEADYSVALQLLLKYPAPPPLHGPHTFVDDALYLRNYLDAAGGATLIMKYTGKPPSTTSTSENRPSTPTFQGFGSLRQRTLGARSPLSASAKLLQQPGGVEAFFQGAAKGMIDRGEKLGINQAVRDAMGEIKRNVQGLQDVRGGSLRASRSSLDQDRSASSDHLSAFLTLERRNRQLAALLDETITSLKILAVEKLEGEKDKLVETIEITAAKVQFVKVHLEDSSLTLLDEDLPPISNLHISSRRDSGPPTVALDTTPVVMTSSAVEAATSRLSPPPSEKDGKEANHKPPESEELPNGATPATEEDGDKMDTDNTALDMDSKPTPIPHTDGLPTPSPSVAIPAPGIASDPLSAAAAVVAETKPTNPIPTRSTLAQSSFSWMLEPERPASGSHSPFAPGSRSPSATRTRAGSHKKQTSSSRDRNAFLFGEVTADGNCEREPSADDIFGLQPIRPRGGLS